MIVWRCPVPAKVFHAFEVPPATSNGRGRKRGKPYESLCGASQLMALRKKYREPETLVRCEHCQALVTRSQ